MLLEYNPSYYIREKEKEKSLLLKLKLKEISPEEVRDLLEPLKWRKNPTLYRELTKYLWTENKWQPNRDLLFTEAQMRAEWDRTPTRIKIDHAIHIPLPVELWEDAYLKADRRERGEMLEAFPYYTDAIIKAEETPTNLAKIYNNASSKQRAEIRKKINFKNFLPFNKEAFLLWQSPSTVYASEPFWECLKDPNLKPLYLQYLPKVTVYSPINQGLDAYEEWQFVQADLKSKPKIKKPQVRQRAYHPLFNNKKKWVDNKILKQIPEGAGGILEKIAYAVSDPATLRTRLEAFLKDDMIPKEARAKFAAELIPENGNL